MVLFFNLSELIDIILMTFAVGFIFKDIIPKNVLHQMNSRQVAVAYDPIEYYQNRTTGITKYLGTWQEWKWAMISVAPGIILHEFGHKFVALGFGLHATFTADYTFLALGIILKLVNFPFLLIVPAYIAISGAPTYLQSALISFAGPAVNGLIWLICKYAINPKKLSRNGQIVLMVTQKLNGFMFIFNMLPIPGFDGLQVYLNLFHIFF